MTKILTKREKEIIGKKISGQRLTQTESNILSKYIRPKLNEMRQINPEAILNKISYNQKSRPIEEKIKKIILKNISETHSIILCGSVVQDNYKEYNDIDVIIATKRVLTKNKKDKLIEKLKKEGVEKGLNLDIQIYSKKSILSQYPRNPSLLYQLKDPKVIYGSVKIPKKAILTSLDLRMKLDWSDNLDAGSKPEEIFYAIRNALLVLLLMNKEVDNYRLRKNLEYILGTDLIVKLRKNTANKHEKMLALNYLNLITNYLEKELKNPKWERIEIENP